MALTLLADADFVIIRRDAWLRRASVAVRDRRIEAVGPAADLAARFPDATRLDCRGRILLPGLINAHNHLYQILLRGLGKRFSLEAWARNLTYPVTRGLAEADHYHGVLLACLDCLRNGTTAVIDMPTHYARHHATAARRALQDAGIRGAVVRAASDTSRFDPGENLPPASDLAAATDFLAGGGDHGRVQSWLGPSGFHSTSPEMMQRMKGLVRQAGSRYHVHLGESHAGLERARAAGFAGEVAWADSVGILDAQTSVAHGVWVNDAEIDLLRRAGAQVVHNPASNMVLASGVAPIARMRAAGVTVALGTDGPASNDGLDLFSEMKLAVLLQRVHSLNPLALTAADVFAICTEGGARVLGHSDLGRLEPGCLADITAVQAAGNPSLTPVYDPVESLVFHGSGRDVVLTMVDGEVLYHQGAFARLDATAVLAAVTAIRDRISAAHAGAIAGRGTP